MRLRDELNVLLGSAKYHDPAARPDAERRFDPRVANIFFDKMLPEETDSAALRDAVIALPETEPAGYRRVLFLALIIHGSVRVGGVSGVVWGFWSWMAPGRFS